MEDLDLVDGTPNLPTMRALVLSPDDPLRLGAEPSGWQEYVSGTRRDGANLYRWPDNDGAVAGTTRELSVAGYESEFGGKVLSRSGDEGGRFAAPLDHGTYYDYAQVSLPPESLDLPFHHYRFTKSADALMSDYGVTMFVEEVLPWFGQGGGGMQMRWIGAGDESLSLAQLRQLGILEEVVSR